jgi:hypothetical protein
MAYATIDDVDKILPEDETIPDDVRVQERLETNLEEATDLIIGFLERQYSGDDTDGDGVPDDVPNPVRRVVARVAMRGFTDEPDNPGAEGEVSAMGPFSHTINWSKEAQARDFYLTDSDKLRLEPYRLGYTGGAAHAPMSGACGTSWYMQAYQ